MQFKKSILNQVYKPDEKLLFSKVLDQAILCHEKNITTFTKFLNPYNKNKFIDIIKEYLDIEIYSFGGAENCEREKIGFCKKNSSIEKEDFPIETLEIKYKNKFKQLGHKDFLGSILNLGIDRSNLGDILVLKENCFVFIDKSIGEFVSLRLNNVNNTKVETIIIKNEDICVPLEEFEEKKIKINSIRLDNIISSSFKLSRSKVSELIKSKKAYINWLEVNNNSFNSIKEGDIISLRGYGRVKIKEIESNKKNDSYYINVYIYK